MADLASRMKDMEDGRANDMAYLEDENNKMEKKIDELTNELAKMKTLVTQLQGKMSAGQQQSQVAVVPNLTNQVNDLSDRLQKVESVMATKQDTVFGVNMNTNEDLSGNTWKQINKFVQVYTPSPCFKKDTCSFQAPIKGDYYMDMGIRQDGDGGLEAAFNGKGTSNFKHAYVGNTSGNNQVCHKTVVVSLNKGDTVFGIVRRIAGEAKINWCAFHGCLISGDVKAQSDTASGGGQ